MTRRTRIKICGITRAEDLQSAVEQGAEIPFTDGWCGHFGGSDRHRGGCAQQGQRASPNRAGGLHDRPLLRGQPGTKALVRAM